MKIVIAGGTGQLGTILRRMFLSRGDEVVILSRSGHSDVHWDAKTLGPWVKELDGADAVINLSGKSVNCRYTKKNLAMMMSSRVDSTKVVGEAIRRVSRPPRVWLQMSTATIYSHRFDAPNDEKTGIIGGKEPGAPPYWSVSIDIAKAWEKAQAEVETPFTRKVALRTAMVMSPDRGGIFDVLLKLVKARLGGTLAGGQQFISFIHDVDFARAIQFLIERDDLSGPFNLVAPFPLQQREFMSILRHACGIRLGLPAAKWMLEIGAWFLRTDTELLLKSRRVIPTRLLEEGFAFHFSHWKNAAIDLVKRHENEGDLK